MPFDSKAFVLRQHLFTEPSLEPHRSAAGQDGIRCACRIDWMMFFNLVRWRTT
jgi:hypothetical protein